MDISIIIVNYNTKKLTSDCIDSIISHTKDIEYEIVVVDNASVDGSIEEIPAKYPCIKFIEAGDNLGFGKANNLGAKNAAGKYFFLLNSDTVLKNNAVKKFYDYAENSGRNEILGTHLLDADGQINNSGGNFEDKKHIYVRMLYLYFPFLLKLRKKAAKVDFGSGEQKVDYVTGADIFILADTYRKLGGFDESFFMYSEDTDLCKRAAEIDVSCRLIEGPSIVHLEGKSGNASKKVRDIRIASYKHYLKKWF